MRGMGAVDYLTRRTVDKGPCHEACTNRKAMTGGQKESYQERTRASGSTSQPTVVSCQVSSKVSW